MDIEEIGGYLNKYIQEKILSVSQGEREVLEGKETGCPRTNGYEVIKMA